MQIQNKITATYDKIAAKYAQKFINELDYKPLDKILLSAFAEENKKNGRIIDLGCGPGQTTRFLAGCGADIIGTDISPVMITAAKKLNPALEFEVANITDLKYPNNEFSAAIAFYVIVNFDYSTIKTVFEQVNRVLKPGAQFLFCFHVGDEILRQTNMLDEQVDINFYFLDPDKIIALLNETGFKITDALIRFPYEQEYQSKRAYIKAEKI